MSHRFHLYLYGPNGGPIPTSFDDLFDRLAKLDRYYCEPDGSFGWSQEPNESIFGMAYDAAGQVQYVELRGQCDLATWKEVVCAIYGDHVDAATVMCLQKRQRQDLQTFESFGWKLN